MELSGGMKRRVLIAKALCHEPRVLFLDEPTAGVDVELRKDMWDVVRQLKQDGVTIILTTHYIEEAEAIADRVGVIRGGELLLVEEKAALMQRMGQRQLRIELMQPLEDIPEALSRYDLDYDADNQTLIYSYDTNGRAHRHRVTVCRSEQGRDHPAGHRDQAKLARRHLRGSGARTRHEFPRSDPSIRSKWRGFSARCRRA
jgi:ABC-type multidrug transport system ATPase subunit